jgi:hypothetical protein
MSTFEEKVKAKIDSIREENERNQIEMEARRRINAEKRKQKKIRKQARAKAEAEEQARAKAEAEEQERKIKITGLKARINRLEYDIEHDVYTYKRIMSYRDGKSIMELTIIDNILSDIKKTHDSNLALLAVKTQLLRSIE